MKWVVTGGCGFIGTNLIADLVDDQEHTVRIVDNLSVGTPEALRDVCEYEVVAADDLAPMHGGGGVELVIGDVLDEDLALRVTQGADVIVHLAANTGVAPSVEDPRADCRTNVFGTLNYLEGARHNDVRRFVFASSGAPVGECEPPIHEELAPHPVSPYGASKLAGEGYCSAYFRTYGVETVALRFGNVYGPRSSHKSSVIANFIQQAIAGEILIVYGDGTQTRDFIYVGDLVRAIMLTSNRENLGAEIFQIATNTTTSLNDIIDLLKSKMRSMNADIRVRYVAPRLGDVKHSYSEIHKAREFLGWEPMIEFVEGIERTISWFSISEKFHIETYEDE